MKHTFYIPALIAFGIMVSQVQAAGLMVNGVDLGSCKSYFDGCNTCSVMENGQSVCTKMACFAAGTPKCLDTPATSETDTQLTDMENSKSVKDLTTDFKLKTFNSCAEEFHKRLL